MKINEITHPEYVAMIESWRKFRDTYDAGHDFVKDYVEKFSTREDTTDYNNRIAVSYCPAHAKAAIVDVKNAIYERMGDIKRENGPDSYMKAIAGDERGVDLTGNTMTGFIGRLILPELLAIGKVGVYIDRPIIEPGTSKANDENLNPYLYYYGAESIRSWSLDDQNNLISLLLQDNIYVIDEETGLVIKEETQYRLLRKIDEGISVQFYDKDGAEIKQLQILKIKEIPFVIFELSSSLLTDVADYQIALVNLASTSLNYALKSNYPFYTEQFSPLGDMAGLARQAEDTGEADEAKKASAHTVKVGAATGRRYPINLERPGFIHPSPEPLRVSMEMNEKLKAEIRQLISLAITNIEPRRASLESKKHDDQGLEAGLSYIGLELAYGERAIARIWSQYENYRAPTNIQYPQKYSLRNDDERREDVKEKREILPAVPSMIFQKELAKDMAETMLGSRISSSQLQAIFDEIDASTVVVNDPEVIHKDLEGGLVSVETASLLRGYPPGEDKQAAKDHAERAARIALAQSEAGARGVSDLSADKKAGEKEKAAVKDAANG
jgi:hypothetical protein